jgi:glycine/D-amino acid oxidase-like deaminating enzyme
LAGVIVVVGAGICGLAAAYELGRRGVEVVVLERAEPGGAQSAGLARIFRVAHGRTRLCALALEAREGWRRWGRELGEHLLGEEGLVVASPRETTRDAMREAGAAFRELGPQDIRVRIPFAAPAWEHGLLDPAAGSIRVRRAIAALAGRVEVRRAEVAAVGDGVVTLTDGSELRGDAVLVCAGTETAALTGLDLGVRYSHHVRLTYRAEMAGCLISPEGYGVPLGSTGQWAFGLHDGDVAIEDADAFAAAARERQAAVVPELFPGLDPRPIAEVRCVNVHADWQDEGGDGWHAVRSGRTLAFAGANLMKFGPLLGDRLAQSALDLELHADLIDLIER